MNKKTFNNNHITFLGTGNAHATHCYNTCFTLHINETLLLVDGGGGNAILTQLERSNINLADIHDIFVTHAHTDHLLGVVWIVRMALEEQQHLRIWSHRKVLDLLTYICRQTLPHSCTKKWDKLVELHFLNDGEKFVIGDITLQCFDIHSTKEQQFGFTAQLPDGRRLCCLGDEPFNPLCQQFAKNADWLMSEAFCLYEDREQFQPYEKHHSTVLDAARLAEKLRVKNLILYHTEDRTLDTRRERYTMEAKKGVSMIGYTQMDLGIAKYHFELGAGEVNFDWV